MFTHVVTISCAVHFFMKIHVSSHIIFLLSEVLPLMFPIIQLCWWWIISASVRLKPCLCHPQLLNDSFSGYRILGWQSFFSTLNVYFHYFLLVVQSLSCVWLFVIPWTSARQACLCFTYLPEFVQTHLHWVSYFLTWLVSNQKYIIIIFMLWCIFLYVACTWISLSFWGLWIYTFHQTWKFFSHYFF